MPLLFLFFLLLTPSLMAQVFPVRADLRISPPFSPYLSDYATPAFVVQIRLNDLGVADYRCTLRLTIEGGGISVQSRKDYPFTPIVLHGGTTAIYSGLDLYPYFQPEALIVEGLAPNASRAQLPEGLYRFGIEVVDYHRGMAVSNRAVVMVWVVLNDPPMLTRPYNFTTVPLHDPILFTWTPRHMASPNAAFTTTYTFRMIELWPENRNPYDAFLTLHPLFEVGTETPQWLYDASGPPLIAGRKYAWQVQAHDPLGQNLFKNQGRSEVFVFRFGEALDIPGNLRMRWAKPTTLAIRWDAVKSKTDVRYRLQYRQRKRRENHTWYETWTRYTDKTLYELRANTEYEMRIRAEDAVQESPYSESRIFKTLREPPAEFQCRDDILPPPSPNNTLPVFPLSINDTIRAGGYTVLVRDVMRDGSRYYGSGFAVVPWLNGAKVRVTFEGIRVNDRFWLTSGVIRSVWDGDSRHHIEHQAPVKPGHVPQAGALDITVVAVDSLIAIEGAVIAAVTKDEDGNTVVTTTDGVERVVAQGKSLAVVDEMGNGYVIDADGNVAKTTSEEAVAAFGRGSREYDLTLEFTGEGARFGFDAGRYDALGQYYQRLDNGVYIPWKALSSATPDQLAAVVTSAGVQPNRIAFESDGIRLQPVVNGKAISVSLQGKAEGLEGELVAFYSAGDTLPPKVAGKVNLATYNPLHCRLEIVPVNGVAFPDALDAGVIARALNEVYSQAVVAWDVTVAPDLRVPLGDTFNDEVAGGLSNYTDDMKSVLNAYGPLRDNTWYLFVVATPRDMSTLGYMPRNRPAGFVFTEPHHGDAKEFLKTIAHELGHGAFNLKHTFGEHPLPVGFTDNLMDYSDGTALCKYQWDNIHQPPGVLGLFEGTENFYESGNEFSFAAWNRLPPFRKAARILREHLEATGVYETVSNDCDEQKCVITAALRVAADIQYTLEATLPASMSADDLIVMLITEYRVDLWNAFDVRAENIWDELYHWWRKQNDDLAEHKGWQVSTLNFIADVVTAPTLVPAVNGWLTGHHWRDGRTLSGWEQAFAALDFLVAEEMAKACITKLVVRVGTRTINLMRLSAGVKDLIRKALDQGLSISAHGQGEITILNKAGRVVGKIVDEVLMVPYSKFGGDIICAPNKTTTVIGRFSDMADGDGIKFIKENKLYVYGENVGGINILDDANWSWLLNERWLRDAVERGDVIRVVSNPAASVNLWADGIVGGIETTFAKEVRLLESLGYRFDATKFEFVK